jgi:hypothetical protein
MPPIALTDDQLAIVREMATPVSAVAAGGLPGKRVAELLKGVEIGERLGFLGCENGPDRSTIYESIKKKRRKGYGVRASSNLGCEPVAT